MSDENELPDLDAASLLSAPSSPRVVRVPCPEKGGAVYVRMLTGLEKADFQNSLSKVQKDGSLRPAHENVYGRFAALVLCKKDGQRMFADRDALSVGAQLDADSLDRIWEAGRKLNRMSEESKEDARGN